MKFFKRGQEQSISQVVVLAMVFGFMAGVVGQLVTQAYINPIEQQYLLNPNIDIANTIPELRRVKRFLGIEQDFEVTSAIDKIGPTVVGIYRAKPAGAALSQIYLPSDLLATGFALTSDGWIVSYIDSITQNNFDDFSIIYNDDIFSIDQVITDSVTQVVFLKISANNLPVAVLGDSEEMNSGQLALTLNDLGEIIVNNIKNVNSMEISSGADYVLSSEEYNEFMVFEGSLPENYLGSPLVNLIGEVVGITAQVGSSNKIIPINQFRPLVLDVLRSNLVKRAFLGVEYIDLAKAKGLSNEITQGQGRGALVYITPARSTPAFTAGILKNDIILNVNGQPIDQASSLTDLIQQYKPGDKISLEIIRQKQNITAELSLALLP